MQNKFSDINISTGTILKIIVSGLVLWFLWTIRDILLLILIAVTLASALEPLVEKLHRRKIPRAVSVLTVYLLAIFLVVVMGYLFIRPVLFQIAQLAANPSSITDTLQAQIGSSTFNSLNLGKYISQTLNTLGSQLVALSGSFYDRTLGVFNGVLEIITILVISFYLVADPQGMGGLINSVVPIEHQPFALMLVRKIQRKIGWWVIGQFIISVSIFVLVLIGLTLLGVKYALVLAILAGFLEFIPYIGPVMFAIPGIFFAFVQNPTLAIPVAIMYLVVQKTEGYILVPKVMQKTVGISPLVILLAIIIGLKVAGIFGVILAVPIASAINVVIQEWRTDPAAQHPGAHPAAQHPVASTQAEALAQKVLNP